MTQSIIYASAAGGFFAQFCHICLSAMVVNQHSTKKKKNLLSTTLDVCTQTELRSEKGEETGCQTAALTPPININKKVPVMIKQSRAKRPLLHNTIHAQVHVCLAGVYATRASGIVTSV